MEADADTARKSADRNRLIEWSFTAKNPCADPFNTVTLDAVFTTPHGVHLRVPAFWDGGATWKVRYASPEAGLHSFVTECSDRTDRGLNGIKGSARILAGNHADVNALFRHGPVRVAANHRTFEHADGAPFLWLGDTWWFGLSKRLSWPGDFQMLAADRKAKGFNVVQIVAGLYPELPPLDPNCANEAGLPWETDYSRVRPEYWDLADRRIFHLVESGFAPCIVGAWGYFMPSMGAHRLEQHWRYIIARWGALPALWCIAGEVNLPYYHNPKFPFDDTDQAKAWMQVVRYVRDTDPYRRPLTVHPTGLGNLSARGTADANLLDYDMLQTGHGGMNDLDVTIKTALKSYAASPTLPVVQGEVNYEALLGLTYNPASIQRLFYWACMLSGNAGYTYGGNGIWQVNLEGQPRITYGNYPVPTWQEAIKMPGGGQIALGHQFLSALPWTKMVPHPEWVSAEEPLPLNLDGSHWIWYPEGNPSVDAPVAKRWFRREFKLDPQKTLRSARIAMAADDAFMLWVNGMELGPGNNWKTAREFDGVQKLLKPGTNLIAVMAENGKADVPANPAGLVGVIQIEFQDGTTEILRTDSLWKASQTAPDGWNSASYSASDWVNAMNAAPYGSGPWGKIAIGGHRASPLCAGIDGGMRLVYIPSGGSVVCSHLAPGKSYRVSWINPSTVERHSGGNATADGRGTWQSPLPPDGSVDWLLLLE